MSVPEAAVDEDDGFVFGKNNIRLTRKCAVQRAVDCKSVTHAVEHGTDNQFRFGILRPDPAHVPAALFRRKCVGHRAGNLYQQN